VIALRVAGAIYLALGLGFGAGAVVTLLHFARHGELPMTPWGFRSMSGPFEELGAGRFSMLGWVFAAVCAWTRSPASGSGKDGGAAPASGW
jgi:hypothetical protein